MKIAFAKTGWSDFYQGGPVAGRHQYIVSDKEPHEKYNFLPGPDGLFYAYIPGIGSKHSVPQPKHRENWTVVFVAAYEGTGPLTVVGWYENALFEHDWCERPEYEAGIDFELDSDGSNFYYCIQGKKAFFIDPEKRQITVPGKHFARTSIVYILPENSSEPWRNEFYKIFQQVKSEGASQLTAGSIKKVRPKPNPEVEKVAVAFTMNYFSKQGYQIIDRQADNCGYDIIARSDRGELHVEIKGTSLSEKTFIWTRNERNYSFNPRWRLAIVTNCLSTPKLTILERRQIEKAFIETPLQWEVKAKNPG
ncbi:MAG: DUF3883 domain-containing protein [Candidatus Riflebacteria bacterium]|nr:DUF3883 domain-containing protein [Candidatus Riflebacteria bacterium]